MSDDPTVYVCDEVKQVLRLHGDLFTDSFRQQSVQEQLDAQARRIVDAHGRGERVVVTHIQCWHPELVGHSSGEIMARDFTLSDARQTIAREYGYADWADLHTGPFPYSLTERAAFRPTKVQPIRPHGHAPQC